MAGGDDLLPLCQEALARCLALEAAYPRLPVLGSVVGQLYYLIDLETGVTADRSGLDRIILGVQAAREIEALDLPTANLLHEISALLRRPNA